MITVVVIAATTLYVLWDLFGAAEPSRGTARTIEMVYVVSAIGYLGYLAFARRT